MLEDIIQNRYAVTAVILFGIGFTNLMLQQNLLQTHSELCKEPSIHARTLRRHFIIPLIQSGWTVEAADDNRTSVDDGVYYIKAGKDAKAVVY